MEVGGVLAASAPPNTNPMADRVRITLVCSVCDARNYRTSKAGASSGAKPEPLTMKKFCSTCGKHTLHRESK